MTQEEKINRLAELFAKLNEIKKEIADLIGAPEPKPAKKRQVKKEVKPEKVKKKWTCTRRYSSPGLRDNRLKKMYCYECKTVFETTLPKIDATCTE